MKSLSIILSFITLTSFAQEPVLKGNTFKPVFTHPENLQSADLNGDGLLDLVISGYNDNGIQVYINQENLQFSRLKSLNFDHRVTNFAISDFDGDGDQDIWLANHFFIEENPFDTILINDGNGNFTKTDVMTPVYYFHGENNHDAEFLVNDWNGDGLNDFLKIHRSGPDFQKAIMFTNDGQANFSTSILDFKFIPFEVNLGKHTTMADFDHDGDMDLWSVYGGQLTVFINEGLGQFSVASIAETNVDVDDYNHVIFEDINQDSNTDIQFYSHDHRLTRFINQGDGTFMKSEFEYDGNLYYEDGGFSKGGFIDANGDGILDLWLAGEYEVNSQLLLSSATGMLGDSSAFLPIDENNRRLVLNSDLNSNGTDELVTIGNTGINVWQLESESRFQKVEQSEVNKEWIIGGSNELIDMNGDGRLDSVLAGSNGVYVALSNSQTGFNEYKRWSENHLYSADVLDMNNDGLGDVVGHNSDYELLFLKNTGSSFEKQVLYQYQGMYFYGFNFSTGDIDSNGELDVFMLVNSEDVNNAIIWNQKNGLFESRSIQIEDIDQIEQAIIADLDGDGQAELVATKLNSETFGLETVVYEFTTSGVIENATVQTYGDLYSALIKPFLGGIKQQIMIKRGGSGGYSLLEYDGQNFSVVKDFNLPTYGYANNLASIRTALINDDSDWDFYDSYGLILSDDGEYKRIDSDFYAGIASFGDIDGDSDQDMLVFNVYKGITTYINTTIDQDFSGLWYNPNQDGHGLQVEEVISNGIPQVNLAWYVYDQGEPMWLTGVGPVDGDSATIELGITRGASFGSAFNSDDVTLERWGEMTLSFTDKHKLNMSWDGSEYGFSQGEMELDRLAVLKEVSKTTTGIKTCHSGSWFNPEENGHGFFMQVIAGEVDRMSMSWFTYHNGKQYWVIADGEINGDTAVLTAHAATGPDFPPNYDSQDYSPELWGQITFTVVDDDNASVSWQPQAEGFDAGSLELSKLTYIDRYRCQ